MGNMDIREEIFKTTVNEIYGIEGACISFAINGCHLSILDFNMAKN
jgi:hypothetical protein